MENLSNLGPILILIIITIILFIASRELVTWYTKRNEQITLTKETNLLLTKILNTLKEQKPENTPESDTKKITGNIPNQTSSDQIKVIMCM